MNQLHIIEQHHQLCDEIHQCALEENRFLRQHQTAPSPEFLTRKRKLLEALDQSLKELRALPSSSVRDATSKAKLEAACDRILQIIQLDKENEQLLLRFSLARSQHVSLESPRASASMLQKIYGRTA